MMKMVMTWKIPTTEDCAIHPYIQESITKWIATPKPEGIHCVREQIIFAVIEKIILQVSITKVRTGDRLRE
jgi:hypothetical protein